MPAYVTSWSTNIQGQSLGMVLVNVDAEHDNSVEGAIEICRRVRENVQDVSSPNVWLFPAGFLGNGITKGAGIRAIEAESKLWPSNSAIVVGFDYENEQHGIAFRSGRILADAHRWSSPIAERMFTVGKATFAVFVCGEFVGSDTEENGKHTPGEHVSAKALKREGVGMALCLAHEEIARCHGVAKPPRRAFQRQMQAVSGAGIATALVHRHSNGQTKAGHTNMAHLSDWFLDPKSKLFRYVAPQIV